METNLKPDHNIIQPEPEPQQVATTCANIARVATPSSAGTVSVEVGRLPTQAEAVAAAKVLLRCNGADLDEWTNGEWFDAEADLRALAWEGER